MRAGNKEQSRRTEIGRNARVMCSSFLLLLFDFASERVIHLFEVPAKGPAFDFSSVVLRCLAKKFIKATDALTILCREVTRGER